MKKRLNFFFLFVTFFSVAQNKFEKGYYIKSSGIKTECEILKKKWINSPDFITIKTSSNQIIEIDCNEVIEFSVANIKFKKEFVKSEVSSIDSESFKYDFKKKFLRVLLESNKYSLYVLQNENNNKNSFYVKNMNDTIRELVYKKIETEDNKFKYLKIYKQQLLNLSTSNASNSKLKNLNYTYSDLIEYLKNLNLDNESLSPKIYLNKDSLQVNFKLGIYNYTKKHSFYLEGNIDQQINFSDQNINGINAEIEFIPSILNRNYSLFLEFGLDLDEYKDEIDIVRPMFINPNYHIEYSIKNKFRSYVGLRRFFKFNKHLSLNVSSKIAITEKYDAYLFVERDIDKRFVLKQKNIILSAGVDYRNFIFDLNYVTNNTIDASNYILFGLKYNFLKKHLKYVSLN